MGKNRRFVENEARITTSGYDNAVVREFILGFPKIPSDLDRSDFVRIPWGQNPNYHIPPDAPEWSAPIICIKMGSDILSLEWDDENLLFTDGTYTLEYLNTWVFTGPDFTYEFADLEESQSPLCREWPEGFCFYKLNGPVLDYRILRYDHNLDDVGHYHSTHIMAELEDYSNGDNA